MLGRLVLEMLIDTEAIGGVVMMALVDANYMFTYVDVGCQGRTSDGGVFRNTVLGRKLLENVLMLPEDEPLPNYTQTTFPYVFVADDAFAWGPHLLKPYQGLYEAGSDERVFNYRLSRARRIVENVFGILASVFRVFKAPMLLQPDKVSKIAIVCALLHNFLRRSKDSSATYTPPGFIDTEKDCTIIPGTWRSDVENMTSFLPLKKIPRKSGREAQEIRKLFCRYFQTTGKLPSSPEERKKMACDFKNTRQFEICLGAMDGKHILLKKPSNFG
nr:unnamed protein product [Callosobruchus analis]